MDFCRRFHLDPVNSDNPKGVTCRTSHPDPGRLLSLGDAARRTRTPLLKVREAIQAGRLRTLPALHLGQPIRLVEPTALREAFPQATLQAGPPLDPAQRGIDWIGVNEEDQPPGSLPVESVLESKPELNEVVPEDSKDLEGESRVPVPERIEQEPALEITPGREDFDVDPAPVSKETATPLDQGPDPEPQSSGQALPTVDPMGRHAPSPDWTSDRLADLFGDGSAPASGNDVQGSQPADPDSSADEGLVDGSYSGEPLLGQTAGVQAQAVQLELDVRRFEARKARRHFTGQVLLVLGTGVMVSTWMWLRTQSSDEVLAAPIGSQGEAPLASGGLEQDPSEDTGGLTSKRGDQGAPGLSSSPDSGVSHSVGAPVVRRPDFVIDPEPPQALRESGPACAWWDVTQPEGALRELLGPCQGPWDEERLAVVGLHRHRGSQTCTHHLAFLRDRGGDLAREKSAAAAAKREGLPAPLMTQRVEGAARRMLRQRVGAWVDSGFEAGGNHSLAQLDQGGWRVDSWVRLLEQGSQVRLRRFSLELVLADGPHFDWLVGFEWTAGVDANGR